MDTIMSDCKFLYEIDYLKEFHLLLDDLHCDVIGVRHERHHSNLKPTQSQMSLVVSDIVLKIKFAIKRYETVLYTCNI